MVECAPLLAALQTKGGWSKKYPIELKILRGGKTRPDGIRQLSGYMNSLGAKKGWLVIFDRDESKSWKEKLYFEREAQPDGGISVVGC